MFKLRNFLFSRAFSVTVFALLISTATGLVTASVYRLKDLPSEIYSQAEIIFDLIAIFAILFVAHKWLSWKDLGLRKKGFVKSLFYSTLLFFLLRGINYLGAKENFLGIPQNPQFPLYLGAWFISAFREELVYRGIIFRIWGKQKGLLAGMFISSALFGLIHVYYYAFNYGELFFGQAIRTAFWGPTLAFIFYRTGNIWGISIAHFLNNLSAFLFMLNLKEEPKIIFELLWYATCIIFPFVINKMEQKLSNNDRILLR